MGGIGVGIKLPGRSTCTVSILTHSVTVKEMGDIVPPCVSVISARVTFIYTFRCLADAFTIRDITSWRVHLDVWWIDQSTSLPSGM